MGNLSFGIVLYGYTEARLISVKKGWVFRSHYDTLGMSNVLANNK
ncbi:hypothetical protein JCM19240_4941 [Vibrio maritimus]|uniref:Uncharacterized protein n=1 Tax=Vibrio maritimus TaxID=990268 RepID=A0A090T7W8_9VIBR|nr:hypothetical protein JCM19240_4941 [Vibrio maritimus]